MQSEKPWNWIGRKNFSRKFFFFSFFLLNQLLFFVLRTLFENNCRASSTPRTENSRSDEPTLGAAWTGFMRRATLLPHWLTLKWCESRERTRTPAAHHPSLSPALPFWWALSARREASSDGGALHLYRTPPALRQIARDEFQSDMIRDVGQCWGDTIWDLSHRCRSSKIFWSILVLNWFSVQFWQMRVYYSGTVSWVKAEINQTVWVG